MTKICHGVGGRGTGDQEYTGVGGKRVVCVGHSGKNISHKYHEQVLEEMIQDKRHMMSVVVGKLHNVKSSKKMTFNSSIGLLGNEASYVNRSSEQQQQAEYFQQKMTLLAARLLVFDGYHTHLRSPYAQVHS